MTSTAAFWDALCPEHGGLSHAVIHEAGHAVTAVHLGITFEDVSIVRDPRGNRNDVGRLTGGGVRLATLDELMELGQRDVMACFQFLMAGAIAEKLGWGHWLDGSYETDFQLLRNCAGLLDEQTPETVIAVLGRPWGDAMRSTGELLASFSPAVTEVARALGNDDYAPVTYAEVSEIVGRCS